MSDKPPPARPSAPERPSVTDEVGKTLIELSQAMLDRLPPSPPPPKEPPRWKFWGRNGNDDDEEKSKAEAAIWEARTRGKFSTWQYKAQWFRRFLSIGVGLIWVGLTLVLVIQLGHMIWGWETPIDAGPGLAGVFIAWFGLTTTIHKVLTPTTANEDNEDNPSVLSELKACMERIEDLLKNLSS